jgi:arylsulfatase A
MYSDWIINFMRRHRDRPFMAYYPECLVHEPWDPTPDDPKGGLQANVEYLDKTVGKVMASLDELKLRDRTIVFFSGDNGTGRNGKGVVTEPGVRVPMIVSGPGVKRGEVSRALIDFSDVMPTLASLGGASLPKGVAIDGHSFAHILRGEAGPQREWIFSYLAYERMLRDRRWLLEGKGTFYDCGENRDGRGYKDVTNSPDPMVKTARARFEKILEKLPVPPIEQGSGTP